MASRLSGRQIRYALIGGIAVSIYAEPRLTKGIDILADPEDMDLLRAVLNRLGYEESASETGGWTQGAENEASGPDECKAATFGGGQKDDAFGAA